MTDITTLTETEIVARILYYTSETARLEAELTRRRDEQESPLLTEYWRTHPEMIPLEVGDKLLIADGIVMDVVGFDFKNGLCHVYYEKPIESISGKVPKSGWPTTTEGYRYHMAGCCKSRAAYLQSVAHGSEVSDDR